MSVVKEIPGVVREKGAACPFAGERAKLDEMYQAVAGIEESLGRLAGSCDGLRNEIGGIIEAKIAQALDRRGDLAGACADIAKLLRNRSSGFTDMLGPNGLR